MTIPVEKLVKAYVKIRNKRSELKSEFEDQNKKLADKQAKTRPRFVGPLQRA